MLGDEFAIAHIPSIPLLRQQRWDTTSCQFRGAVERIDGDAGTDEIMILWRKPTGRVAAQHPGEVPTRITCTGSMFARAARQSGMTGGGPESDSRMREAPG